MDETDVARQMGRRKTMAMRLSASSQPRSQPNHTVGRK